MCQKGQFILKSGLYFCLLKAPNRESTKNIQVPLNKSCQINFTHRQNYALKINFYFVQNVVFVSKIGNARTEILWFSSIQSTISTYLNSANLNKQNDWVILQIINFCLVGVIFLVKVDFSNFFFKKIYFCGV